MYSIVLMTAMTAAPEAPQFNGYFRDLFSRDSNGCNGCNGCSGGARYSCSGGSYSCNGSSYSCNGSSAYPASCSGCNGSSCHGAFLGLGLGDRVRSWFEPSGCCGSHSYNCTGSNFSCSGYSCSGSAYSCFGSAYAYTPSMNGGLSCQGGFPYSAPPPMFDTHPGMPGIPYAVPDPAPGMSYRPPAHTSGALASNMPTARAAVIVKLPADAKLSADGRVLNLTGSERKFVSPELPTNQEFVYRFTAEYDRDGETVSVTKKVPVRAGITVTVEFTDLTVARGAPITGTSTAGGADKLDKGAAPPVKPVLTEPVKADPSKTSPLPPMPPVTPVVPTGNVPSGPATDRATITVKLPPGATLYVDERKSPSAEPVRSFSTPPLPAGREYAYLLKAEVMRDGRPETFTQKVPFRAGERVVVDFTSLGK